MADRDYTTATVRKKTMKIAQIYCVMKGVSLVDYVSDLIETDLREFNVKLENMKRLK